MLLLDLIGTRQTRFGNWFPQTAHLYSRLAAIGESSIDIMIILILLCHHHFVIIVRASAGRLVDWMKTTSKSLAGQKVNEVQQWRF